MKLKTKMLLMVLLPLIIMGLVTFFIASSQLRRNITKQTYEGMHSASVAIYEIFETNAAGDYHLDENGDLWKGDTFNISASTDLVDEIKEESGLDVTVFYGDTRYLTTLVDESGNRQVGTQASQEVVDEVLGKGNEYSGDNVPVLGERYICYYLPYYQQDGSGDPIGMIFLGKSYSELKKVITQAQVTMLSFVAVLLVLAVIVASVIAVRIIDAVNKGVNYVEEIGKGNLDIHIEQKLLERKDVIGEMCRTIQDLVVNLTDIVTQIQDQCVELRGTSEDFNNVAGNVLGSVQQIDSSVQEIAAASSSQAQNADSAGKNITVIGNMVHDTSVEVEEMSGITRGISEASDSARVALDSLRTSMASVMDAVDEIATQTSNTHASVQQISEVTNVISEIASQTNLLSLNASIEAARAGEQGKGFAVVATEIQKLAEQSNKSASEIQMVLAQLRANAERSVSTMDDVKETIHVQSEQIEDTHTVFNKLEEGIEQAISSLTQIKEKASVLDSARVETVDIVQNVASIAQQNAASTEETAAAVETVTGMVSGMEKKTHELTDIADVLDSKVKVFKVGEA